MGLLVAGGSRGLFCLLLPGVPELDNGVKGGNGAGGKLHLLVTVLPVHLGAGHGSVVPEVPALCGSAEDVLLGEHLSEGCVPGIVLLNEGRIDGGLGLVPCVDVGVRGGCITVGGGTAKVVGIPLLPGLAHALVLDLAGDVDGRPGEDDLTVRGQILLRAIGGGFNDSFSLLCGYELQSCPSTTAPAVLLLPSSISKSSNLLSCLYSLMFFYKYRCILLLFHFYSFFQN